MMQGNSQNLLNDLRLVGPHKPLGNLPLSTIREDCGIEPEKLQKELENNGIKTLILTKEECSISSGALYVYDEEALAQLLKDNEKTLSEAGWPTQPVPFIRHLKVLAEPETDLFNVIADAYGDKRNPLRKRRDDVSFT
jgi:hypothetical protein